MKYQIAVSPDRTHTARQSNPIRAAKIGLVG